MKKDEFTFVTLSYNQEKYIIQHLESIRWQVTHFCANRKIFYILCDDSSDDKTVELASRWLEEHKNLFYQYKVITHENNLGTVKNDLFAINQIETEKYHILAADDLYYRNDIISALISTEEDLIFTPVIRFIDTEIIHNAPHPLIYLCINKKKDEIYNLIKTELCFGNPIEAPGVFISKKLVINRKFQKWLLKLRIMYYEDYPKWIYFFKDTISIKINTTPFVLYRQGKSNRDGKKGRYDQDICDSLRRCFRKKFKVNYIKRYIRIIEMRIRQYFKQDDVEIRKKIEKEERKAKYFIMELGIN